MIDHNPRSGEKREYDNAQTVRYKIHIQSECTNARLKDEFGADKLFARGDQTVMAHLILGVLALTLDQIWRLQT